MCILTAQHLSQQPDSACSIGSLSTVAAMDHHCTPQVPTMPTIGTLCHVHVYILILSLQCPYLLLCIIHTVCTCCNISTEATARSTPTPTCKERMQTFFQRNKINPQFEYQSDNTTTDRARYRCIVRYTINGRQRKIDSGHYYYSKAEAKDQVAKLVLARENVVQEASRGNAPPSKVWKSQLKEYCDKKEQPNPTYLTVPSGTGYVSTVTCCCSMFQGQVCGSKQEAEHSAAWCALQRLQ